MEKTEKKGIKIHLPTDFVTVNKFNKDASVSLPESLVIFYLTLSLSLPLPPTVSFLSPSLPPSFSFQVGTATIDSGIPDGWMGLDVGKESIATLTTVIQRAATIVWNGPVGVFKFEKFAVYSKTVVMATEKGATSIIGKWEYWCNVDSIYIHVYR